ncbi:hypothetical protein GGR34_000742 [Microvirga flocculans]|uniref:Uncharacterized protein n=1 Tax=Microvirga flocculans TaxID=217168 RepID=A0A7W6N6Z2_9HYPH|nr:hypothetical protein [Microvirga flocculans]MBB4039107.1 hypothetical protein [Microvirga flocculans]
MSQAIGNDAFNDSGLDIDGAADELMKLWMPDDAHDEPSDEPEDEDNDEDLIEDEDESDEDSADELDESDDEDESDEDEEEADEDDEDSDEDDDEPKKGKRLKDDDIVSVKVGDEDIDVPVKDLKRLYGQEKALTQKSMEVAETRKTLESLSERHVAAAEALHQRALKRFEPYAKIDWALAVKELDTEEYKALRDEATRAYEDVQFYEQEVDNYLGELKKARENERMNTARKTLAALRDPKSGIKGFNEKMYQEMGKYAVENGMTPEQFASIVEEAPLRFIAKAMLLDRGKAKVVTKKIDKKNKKIVKSRTAPSVTKQTFSKSKKNDYLNRLRRTGSVEDAAEALLAGWMSDDD